MRDRSKKVGSQRRSKGAPAKSSSVASTPQGRRVTAPGGRKGYIAGKAKGPCGQSGRK